jgi:hypothetical protein
MLVTLPSPIPELQHASLPPQNAASQGVCPDSLLLCCFQFGLKFESIKELGGVPFCFCALGFIFSIDPFWRNMFFKLKGAYICFSHVYM